MAEFSLHRNDLDPCKISMGELFATWLLWSKDARKDFCCGRWCFDNIFWKWFLSCSVDTVVFAELLLDVCCSEISLQLSSYSYTSAVLRHSAASRWKQLLVLLSVCKCVVCGVGTGFGRDDVIHKTWWYACTRKENACMVLRQTILDQ